MQGRHGDVDAAQDRCDSEAELQQRHRRRRQCLRPARPPEAPHTPFVWNRQASRFMLWGGRKNIRWMTKPKKPLCSVTD
jgi:hypothetical protein